MARAILPLHHLAKEMAKRIELLIIGVFFLALFGKFIYLPFDHYFGLTEHKLFPYNITNISIGAYVDYSATWISFSLIAFAHCYIVPKYRQHYFIIGCLFLLMLFEFPLNYNDPWIHWHFVPLSIGLYVGICFIVWFFNVLRK